MNSQPLKIATLWLALATLTVACSHRSNNGPGAGPGPGPQKKVDSAALVEQHAKENSAKLTEVFSQIDPSYDFNNRTLTDKIEGLDLISIYKVVPTIEGVGYAQASIMIKEIETPVSINSGKVTEADLKAGVPLTMTVNAASKPQVEEALGGPLTVTLKCLDGECKQVALYFRVDQGAGYLFEQKEEGGYQMVNSIGPAKPIDQEIAMRGINARNN